MLLLLLATPLDGIADRLGALRLDVTRGGDWARWLTPLCNAAALLALGRSAGKEAGWGCMLLAVVTITFLVALREEKAPAIPADEWLAERKGLTFAMLPFAATGMWAAGLGALAIYAAASFFWAQRHAHADRVPAQD